MSALGNGGGCFVFGERKKIKKRLAREINRDYSEE